MKEPILTVACIAYNQEKYIRQTLEGFVNQKTQYPYVVLVHDDCSTDQTAQIIQEYADKYPEIIIPMFEEENQYQKGIYANDDLIRPILKTKYVAFCEGDDYWCDENKIERQVDFMEKHPDYTFCVHNTRFINENGEPTGRLFNSSRVECDIPTADIIETVTRSLFQFSSFMTRSELWQNQPKEFRIRGVGDYSRAIYFSSCGKTHYFPQIMSAYRVASQGSWTNRVAKNKENFAKQMASEKEDLANLDRLLNYQYHDSFELAKCVCDYSQLSKAQKVLQSIFNKNYRKILLQNIKRRSYE